MPDSYLTADEAETRLTAFGITTTLAERIVEMASDDLDLKGPFVGSKDDEDQHREFPRTTTVQDDPEGEVPPRILDWVALRAYQLTEDDDAPPIEEKVDKIAVTYDRGKRSQQARWMRNLLRLYRTRNVPTA